jgi:hypothetical protein
MKLDRTRPGSRSPTSRSVSAPIFPPAIAEPPPRPALDTLDIFRAVVAIRNRVGAAGHPDAGELAFIEFCAAHALRSRAQLMQDLFVLYMLGSKRGGFFVEFGATDGVNISNTLLLERDFGWTGRPGGAGALLARLPSREPALHDQHGLRMAHLGPDPAVQRDGGSRAVHDRQPVVARRPCPEPREGRPIRRSDDLAARPSRAGGRAAHDRLPVHRYGRLRTRHPRCVRLRQVRHRHHHGRTQPTRRIGSCFTSCCWPTATSAGSKCFRSGTTGTFGRGGERGARSQRSLAG